MHFWNRNYKEAKRNRENEKPDQGGKAVLPLTKRYSSGKEKIEKGKVKNENWKKCSKKLNCLKRKKEKDLIYHEQMSKNLHCTLILSISDFRAKYCNVWVKSRTGILL